MLDILRDNIWTFIGSAVAIVALLVTIYTFFAQKARKRLLVQLRGAIPLMSRRANGVSGITVGFNGRPLTSATIFLVRIENVGNTPIVPADFTTDLILTFSAQAEVLSADAIGNDPADLNLSIERNQNLTIVKPHLLNPGDYATVRILVEGPDDEFKASARIAGVKRLHSLPPGRMAYSATAVTGFCLMIAALWMSGGSLEKPPGLFEVKDIPSVITAAVGALLVLASMAVEISRLLKRHPEGLTISLFRRS